MSIGLIAVGTVCAVAGAAVGVIGTRRHLAHGYAQLAVEQNELDHAGDMQDLRHAELAQWAGWLAPETDRVNRWDAYIASLNMGQGGPDDFDPDAEPEEPTVELSPVKPVRADRSRFSYDPTAVDRVHTVARPEAAEVLVGEQSVLFAARRELEEFAASVAPSAEFVGEHFESEAFDAELREILVRAKWRTLKGGELTELLTAQRVGMPTGQYPMLRRDTNPWDQPKPGDPAPKPKLIGQPRVPAEVLHAMYAAATKDRPGTEPSLPTPLPKPSPAVAA